MESDVVANLALQDDESLELLQFLAEGHARSGTGYPDYPDPASDTGSHTDTSNSGWGSSSYTDSYSESYSESNDAFDSEYDSVESMVRHNRAHTLFLFVNHLSKNV